MSNAPMRVLLIDDQPIIHEAVRQVLAEAKDLDLHCCPGPRDALNMALGVQPAVVLLDIQMEPVGGLQVLDQLRATPALADVSVVMLSATEEPQVKVDAFRRGANDYVVKLPAPLELLARVRYHARACMAAREREAAFQSLLQSQAALAARTAELELQRQRLEALNLELAESALTDPLTGLRNRRYLRRLFGREQGELQYDPNSPLGQVGPVCIHLLDLDHFKQINDRHGHDAGDAVLVEVARRLRNAFPQAPALLRWGGEEILLILPAASLDEGMRDARRIMSTLGDAPMQVPSGDGLQVSCSVGFVPYPFGQADNAPHFETLLTLADSGVYLSKREGRNRATGCWPGTAAVDGHELLAFGRDPDLLAAEDGRRVQLLRLHGPA